MRTPRTRTAPGAVALALSLLGGGGAVSGAAQGLEPSEPIRCRGNERIVLRHRVIETDGDGIVIRGHCEVEIVDSRIEAGGIGIVVRDDGEVELTRSVVRGGELAIYAEDDGDVSYYQSTLVGGVRAVDDAMLRDRGENELLEGAAAGPGASRRGGGDATVRIGPGGIVVGDRSGTVAIGEDERGVRITDERTGETVRVGERGEVDVVSGDESVTIENGRIVIRDGGDTVVVSGDWRRRRSRYGPGDTVRILRELGAEEADGELRVRLAGDVLFDFDSAAIRPDAAAALAKLAHLIRARATEKVYVIGHTDSKGTDEYNLDLSRRRAAAVMLWLNRNEGIPASLLIGEGRGATEPVAWETNPDGSDNPEGRAKNRRVEIRIVTR